MDIVNDIGNLVYINLLQPVTKFPTRTDLTYYVFTRNNEPDVVSSWVFQNDLTSTHFNPNLKTYFVIHGWMGDAFGLMRNSLIPRILEFYNVNVIFVDWTPSAFDPTYAIARAAVNNIGRFLGEDINYMLDQLNYPSSYINLIGFCLGAHIAGEAGSITGGQVYTIVGLDPARPLFVYSDTDNRLDPTDAQFVHVIHTDSNFVSFLEPLGHVEYYPNGGIIQAGCTINLVCSHLRATIYYAESIDTNQVFTAHRCDSYDDYLNNLCLGNPTSRLGQLNVDRT